VVIGARAARLVVGLTAALAVAGCSGKMFRPVTPHAAADPDIVARVDSIYVVHFPGETLDDTLGVRIELVVAWRVPTRIGEARLTSSAAPACASGVKTKQSVSADRYNTGPERISLAFSRPAVEAAHLFDDRSSVLDLTLFPADRSAPGRCVRIAVVESGAPPDAAQWIHRPLLIGGEERVMIFHSQIPGLTSPALLLGVGMGTWYGRWSWMVEAEGGFSGRADPTTGQTGEGRLFGLWGGSASASTLLFDRGKFGLGTIAGYEVLRGVATGPMSAGSVAEPLMLHGPRVGLRLLYLVDPLAWRGFRSPPDAFTGGLTVYVGNWWNGGNLGSASPFLGFALEGNLGF
jgi:hypothetical protein